MWVQSLCWEDALGEGMATHSSILAWRIHRQSSLQSYSPWCHKRNGHDLATKQQTVNVLLVIPPDFSLSPSVQSYIIPLSPLTHKR